MSVWGMISRGEPSPRKEALLHLQSATFAGSRLIINTSIPGNGAIRVDEGDRQWKLLHGHQVSPMKGSSVTPCTARSGSGSGGNKTFPHPPILPNESSAWCPFGWTPPPRSDGKAELPRWPADVKCTALPCVLPDDSPYLTGGHTLLFDLSNDMYEEHDVSAQHPDVVARLLARLEYYNHSHCGGATCPSDPGKFWAGCRGNATVDPKLGSVWLPWQGNPTPSVCDTNRGKWELTELKRFKSDDIAVPAPGGPFGLARKPPMGFRTWNAYQDRVNQTLMEELMEAMVAKQADGRSLLDLGYGDIGLDDGWQSCGGPGSYNGSHHTASGDVLVNLTRFPSIQGLPAKAHSLNLTASFYMNNCICSVPAAHRGHNGSNEIGAWPAWANHTWLKAVMHGNIKFLKEGGWDGLKVDNGGPISDAGYFAQASGYRWADLLLAAKLPIVLESCNMSPVPTSANLSCPYSFFRTSRDIRPNWPSVINNLATVVPFLGPTPLSRRSCWAYPDMLQVASAGDPARHDGTLSAEEGRSHFGAWAIVSSPLTLGFSILDKAKMRLAWPVISNEEIIRVNQAYHGHPGRLVRAWSVNGTLGDTAGGCADAQADAAVCRSSFSLWSKPQADGAHAVFLLSNQAASAPKTGVRIAFDAISPALAQGSVAVRDLWARKDLGQFDEGSFATTPIGGHDSHFLMFTPAQ